MTDKLPRWVEIVLACIVAVLFPGILKLLLGPELSWLLLFVLVWGKIVLAVLSTQLPGIPGRAFRILSTLYTVGLASVVLTGILITPYSAYGIWFETVRDGEPRGVVSILMVLLAAVFSSALAQRFLYSEIMLPLYGELLIAAGLLSLIYQTRLFYILLLCSLALGSPVLSFRFVQPQDRLRNLAAFFLFFLALGAVSRIPALFAEPRGSRIVDQQLHPGLRQTVVTLFPRFPLLYGIPGFGYGFETKRLGGTPILSEAPIFDIQGQPGQRLYLRTAAYSTYDGQSWSRRPAAEGTPPFRQVTETEEQTLIQVLDSGEAPVSAVRVTLLAEYYTLVPFTLNTRSIYLPAEQTEGISGSFEYGFQLATPLRSGQSIYLEQGRRPGERESSSSALSAEEAGAYLQLPDRLTPELRGLAGLLEDPEADTRGTLRNIERYLAQNYTYNLEAKRIPAGADFVDTFLFQNKEGYCVHFASSFAVLARLNGIPTRYATGFLTTLPAGLFPFEGNLESGHGTVSGLSSHAWPEVWLEDRGWTAWEATTAVNPSYYEEFGEDWLFEYGRVENRLTNRQLRAILGREPVSQKQATKWSWSFNWQVLLLLIPLSALILAATWAIRRYGILVLAMARPNRLSALKVVAKIVSSRDRRGVEPPESRGWVQWVHTSFQGSPQSQPKYRRLLVVVQRLVYSGHGFRKRDLRFLSAFYLKYCISFGSGR
jgi:transglutaminase-like putative cysteine protease